MSAHFPGRPIRAYAHRGGSAEAPENSGRAFAAAVDLGYRHLETDVRGTRDGVAVVHHDATLDRTTDRTGRIGDLAWTHVRRARIAGSEPVLRLEELLEAFPEAHFNIDLKDDAVVAPALDALRRTRSLDRVCLTSFSARRLRAARRRAVPPSDTSAGPGEVLAHLLRSRLGDRVVGISRRSDQRLQVPWRPRLVDPRFIGAAHARGLAVDVWTVNDEADMVAAVGAGVDGIMTDRPTLLRDVLLAHGRWEPSLS